MLQQDEPDDYVLATGESHTVEEFCSLAFENAGMPLRFEGEGMNRKGYRLTDDPGLENRNAVIGTPLVEVDPAYFRPTEVDFLQGDPTKARKNLGWKATEKLDELARRMVKSDLALAVRERL